MQCVTVMDILGRSSLLHPHIFNTWWVNELNPILQEVMKVFKVVLSAFPPLFFSFQPQRVTTPHRGLEQEGPKRHDEKKCIFKQPTKRKEKKKKYEHLTAYLSISTARELSLTLISVAGWGWKGLAYSHCFSFVHVGLALLSPVFLFSCLTSCLILSHLQ